SNQAIASGGNLSQWNRVTGFSASRTEFEKLLQACDLSANRSGRAFVTIYSSRTNRFIDSFQTSRKGSASSMEVVGPAMALFIWRRAARFRSPRSTQIG